MKLTEQKTEMLKDIEMVLAFDDCNTVKASILVNLMIKYPMSLLQQIVDDLRGQLGVWSEKQTMVDVVLLSKVQEYESIIKGS